MTEFSDFIGHNAPLIAVLAIVLVVIPTIVVYGKDAFDRWLVHKETMANALTTQTAEKAAQYAAQTERLEQRVRVLERIVTDRGIDLSDQIDRLREAPLN